MSRICKTRATRVHQIQKAAACWRVKIYGDLTSSKHKEHTPIIFHRIACRHEPVFNDLWHPTRFFLGDTRAVIVTILRDIIVTSVIIKHKWRLIESKVDLSTLVLLCPQCLMRALRSVRAHEIQWRAPSCEHRLALVFSPPMKRSLTNAPRLVRAKEATSISATFESAARWMRYAMNFRRRSLLSCVHNYRRKKLRCSSPSMNPIPISPQLMIPLSNTKWATNVGLTGRQTVIFFFKL